MTKRLGDIRLPYRHFERNREIFVIRRLSGIAIIYTSRRFPIFMRRTTPVEPIEPIEPIEPAEPLSLETTSPTG